MTQLDNAEPAPGRALAREFHLNRRTVNREVEAAEPRRYPRRSPRHPFSAAQSAHVERRLAVCPSVRATDHSVEFSRACAARTARPGPPPQRKRVADATT